MQCYEMLHLAGARQAQDFQIFRQMQFSDFETLHLAGVRRSLETTRQTYRFKIRRQIHDFKIRRQAQFSVTICQTCIMSGIVYRPHNSAAARPFPNGCPAVYSNRSYLAEQNRSYNILDIWCSFIFC